MSERISDVIILGGGPAGLTAAIYAARAHLAPLVLEGHAPGGQLTTTTDIENFPGFASGIAGPALMEEMRKQALRFGAEIVPFSCVGVRFDRQPFGVLMESGEQLGRSVIVATGAQARMLGLPQERELLGFGLSTCATCDGAFYQDREIVVVGGGDSACEEALFLTRFGRRVRCILRRDVFRASKIMVKRVMEHPKIEVIFSHRVVELLGTRKAGLTGCIIEHAQTGERTEVASDAVFYAIGHMPNSSLFRGLLDMDENGYLITKPDSTRTNIPGIFACGDIQDHTFRQAITAAGSGCMAAIEAERYIAELEDRPELPATETNW